MKSFKRTLLVRAMCGLHFLVMVILFFAFWCLFYRREALQGAYGTHSMAVLTIYTIALYLLSRIYQAYNVGLVRVGELLYNQTLANLISLGMSYVLASILALQPLNPLPCLAVGVVQLIVGAGWTVAVNRLYFAIHKPKQAVVVYRSEKDLKKLEEINYFDKRWQIVDRICWDRNDISELTNEKASELAAISRKEVLQLLEKLMPYQVVFVSGVEATLRNGIVKYCVEADKECFFVPHTGDVIISGASHVQSFSVPICRARRSSPNPEFLVVKRVFDIVVSLLFLILFSPFMLVTAIAIKCYDKGPVLYRQIRLTKDGRPFEILKFRSMRADAERDGVARLASANDDRITPVGKVIRAIRFDELPQLLNILRGDMSIVGPRPERPEIAAQYRKELPAFDLRLQVKAGLTGYAQVYGRYNTEPADKLKMDLMYINNISMAEDIKLMFATVRILFMRESTQGVSDGQDTALQQPNQ